MKLALSGAAPIDTDILEFFHAAGVWVLEGYGMTENCARRTRSTRSRRTASAPSAGRCRAAR